MIQISSIKESIKEELDAFNVLYKDALKGHSAYFQSMIDYVLESDGKKIRPILLLLSAKTCGKINPETLEYALILELVHNATLIHDDVVDDTKERRGRLSFNAKFDNKSAVLVGDYVLSIAIARAVMTGNMRILNIISNLALNLVEGELSQMAIRDDVVIDETNYFDVIRKKTATLLSSCAEMGALSAGVNEDLIEKFRLFGEYVGICFQIKDDIFDYYEQGEIGKPTGNDIREGKVTLPLIYALNNTPKDKNEPMLQLINRADFTPENVTSLISFAKENGGIDYAYQKMEEYKRKSIDILAEIPDTEAKKNLLTLVEFIVERNK